MRADFYARCLDEPVLEDALKHRSYLLGPMRLDELAEALTRPAEMAGYKLESGLDELVITELCGIGGGGDRRSYDPGALPLVSHVMEAVWQRRDGSRLTIEGYRAAGGVLGSVSATAETAWGELTDFQQAVGKQVLLGLVAVGGDTRDTRRRVSRAELLRQTVDAADTALDALARTRLVTLDADTAYLTHEIVLDAWPRLRSWIDEDRVGNLERQRLQSDATEWVEHRHDPSLLYRGARLTTMREHARRGALGTAAQEFLTASEAARQRAQRRSAARRAALVLLTIVSVVLAGFAFLQSRNASHQRDNAIFNSVLAEADRLETSDPSLSAQLDLVAGRLRPGDPEVRARLVNSEGMPLASALVGHHGYISGVAIRPDGRVLASAGSDRTVQLWDISDRRNPHPIGKALSEDGDQVDRLTFSPDGATLAVSDAKVGVVLWDVRDPGHPTRFGNPIIPSYGEVIKFSPDGKVLAASDKDNALEFWNIADPLDPRLIGDPVSIPGHEKYYMVALSADLRRAVIVGVNDIQLWELDASYEHATLSGTIEDFSSSVELSPDGTVLAVLAGESVDLWNLAIPDRPQRVAGQISDVQNTIGSPLVFSNDGHEFATVDSSGQIRMWDLPSSNDHWIPEPTQAPMGGARGTIESVAFSADGRTLAAAGQDGIIRLWSMPGAAAGQWPHGSIIGAYSNVIAVHCGQSNTEIWRIDSSHSARIIGRIDDGLRPDRRDSPDTVSRVVISPDMRTMAVFHYPSVVQLFDLSDPASTRYLTTIPVQEDFNVLRGAFSPDSAQLVLSGQLIGGGQNGDNGGIQVWNTADRGNPVPLSSRISTVGSGVSDVQFDPVNRYLAEAGDDGTVRIWDMHNPTAPIDVANIRTGQAENGIAVRFSNDGKTLIGTSVDDSLRIWDVTDPRKPGLIANPPVGARSPTRYLTVDSGNLFVSADESGEARLWNMSDPGHPAGVHHPIIGADTIRGGQITFHPDGRHLIGTGADGVVRTWDLDTAHEVVRICDITRGTLTPQVWRDQLPDLPYRPPCK
nr:WD40 repeat domain-containing protein [Nocardia alni]